MKTPAIKLTVRDGRLVYVVHGIVETYSMEDALELIGERRSVPREPQSSPLRVMRYEGVRGFLEVSNDEQN